MEIDALLKAMNEQKASDLHLRVGSPPIFRINGSLFQAKMPTLTLSDMDNFIESLLTPAQKAKFEVEEDYDVGIGVTGVGRFRINLYRQRNTIAFAIRSIKTNIPIFSDLHLPDVIMDIATMNRGFILVTGTTGSGKSTLLASMIDHINNNKAVNVITIEDPIEFLHKNKKSTIVQREIGSDTLSFHSALRASFRQDPDVIMIGEIRDKITMETGLSASDTGHLVMSTLHTMNAMETITRVVSYFPPYQHDQVRLILSNVLVAIISLRLVPRADGNGLVPAAEILINNATISEYIYNLDQLNLIPDAIADGYTQYGSQTFDQSLQQLLKDELITFQTAMQYASNPDDFELRVAHGISGISDRSITAGY